jgi:hypothetical protein
MGPHFDRCEPQSGPAGAHPTADCGTWVTARIVVYQSQDVPTLLLAALFAAGLSL